MGVEHLLEDEVTGEKTELVGVTDGDTDDGKELIDGDNGETADGEELNKLAEEIDGSLVHGVVAGDKVVTTLSRDTVVVHVGTVVGDE